MESDVSSDESDSQGRPGERSEPRAQSARRAEWPVQRVGVGPHAH